MKNDQKNQNLASDQKKSKVIEDLKSTEECCKKIREHLRRTSNIFYNLYLQEETDRDIF